MCEIGDLWRKKKILDKVELSNGWIILKTENSKSTQDFKVRTVLSIKPRRSYTPKHAHFVIDFYGKLCKDKKKGSDVLRAVTDIWHGKNIKRVISKYSKSTQKLPGYNLEYILYALRWILDQEDINFNGRPSKKQDELDELCKKQNIKTPSGREGSQLAIALFCDVASGAHPVEALLRANLDIRPNR